VLRPAAAQNLLRISCTAAHSEAHVERLVATLERVADQLGIERSPA
jgi:7-keto-8-aminopelargonate synthetase-like enzyme